MHAAEPATATCVLLHVWQSAIEVAPGAAEAVLTGHDVHTVLPPAGIVVCVPAAHATQCASENRAVKPLVVVPGMHSRHVAMLVALVKVEYVPLKQSVHAAFPGAPLCVPAGHALHDPPFGPVQPALQVHVFEMAPVPGVFELDEQGVHDACPDAVLYVPRAHKAQVAPTAGSAPALHVQAAALTLRATEFEFGVHVAQGVVRAVWSL